MKKFISLFLTILIVATAVIAVPVFAVDKTYEKGSVVKLTFTANDVNHDFTALEGELTFSDKLTIDEDSVKFPHISDIVYSVSGNSMLFDATNLDNYDISSDKIIMSAEFTVNETTETLDVKCVIDDIYYRDGKNFIVPEGVTLPYTLKMFEGDEPPTEAVTTEPVTTSRETDSTEETTAQAETTSSTDTTESVETTSATEPASSTVEPTEPESVTGEPTEPASSTVEPQETTAPETVTAPTAKPAVKKANPIKVTVKKKTVKAKTLDKKTQIIKAVTVKKAQGKVTFAKLKSGTTKKYYKKLTVNKTTGKVKLKKGKYTKGTIKLKVIIFAKGNSKYKSKTIKKTIKIKVK